MNTFTDDDNDDNNADDINYCVDIISGGDE